MEDPKNQTPNDPPGAAGSGDTTPAPTIPTTPKVEVKDGSILLDGRKAVYESDLIAAKQGLESKLEQAQTVHNQAMDTTKLELSAALQQVADLNAKVATAEQARDAGATPDEDVVRIKQELADALTKVGTLQVDADKALELRRALLSHQYTIPPESLADKDMKQLDSFEEALKALATSRGSGPGPYAIGGGLGGAVPMTPQERAAKVLAVTPVGGVRTAESNK